MPFKRGHRTLSGETELELARKALASKIAAIRLPDPSAATTSTVQMRPCGSNEQLKNSNLNVGSTVGQSSTMRSSSPIEDTDLPPEYGVCTRAKNYLLPLHLRAQKAQADSINKIPSPAKNPQDAQISNTNGNYQDSLFGDYQSERSIIGSPLPSTATAMLESRFCEESHSRPPLVREGPDLKGTRLAPISISSSPDTRQGSENQTEVFSPNLTMFQHRNQSQKSTVSTLPSASYHPPPLAQPHLRPYLPQHIQQFLQTNPQSFQSPYASQSPFHMSTEMPKLTPASSQWFLPLASDLYMLVQPDGTSDPEAPIPFPLLDVVYHAPISETPSSDQSKPKQYITLFCNGTWASYFRKVTYKPGDMVETGDFLEYTGFLQIQMEVLRVGFEEGSEWVDVKGKYGGEIERKGITDVWRPGELFVFK